MTDCDSEPEQLQNFTYQNRTYNYQLYATLMGQDWSANIVNPHFGATFVGHPMVTIVEDVVAVYEKTVRLEY